MPPTGGKNASKRRRTKQLPSPGWLRHGTQAALLLSSPARWVRVARQELDLHEHTGPQWERVLRALQHSRRVRGFLLSLTKDGRWRLFVLADVLLVCELSEEVDEEDFRRRAGSCECE